MDSDVEESTSLTTHRNVERGGVTMFNSSLTALSYIHSRSISSDNIGVPTEKERPVFLRLNIGGSPFTLSIGTILKRGEIGFLYKFATSSHENRLPMCDDFNPETDEYFFEHSSFLFNPIYLYYVNGMRSRLPIYLRDHFIEELKFWGLARVFYPDVLSKRSKAEIRQLSLAEKFRCVRLGRVREKIWHFCDTPESSKAARVFAICSMAAVLLSNLALILGSMPQFQRKVEERVENGSLVLDSNSGEPLPFLEIIEYCCVALFSFEFAAKILACPDRREFFYNYLNLIDFVAIAPFYFELLVNNLGFESSQLKNMQDSLLVMRILRVMRVVRLFKLGRHSTGLRTFVEVMISTLFQLGMVMGVVAIGMVFFSTLIYYMEKDNNEKFGSIPQTLWWSIVTITTVGYGDMVPETTGGKLVASCAITMGVLVLSMPITIFVNRFINVQEEELNDKSR